MPSLIDLRRRIRAVKSTQQITKAMKMIAASRLRRAQERVVAARPFAQRMLTVLNGLVSRVEAESHPLLRMPDQSTGPAAAHRDHGRSWAVRQLQHQRAEGRLQFITEEAQGREVALGLVGRKGRDFFRRRGFDVRYEAVGIFQRLSFNDAAQLANVGDRGVHLGPGLERLPRLQRVQERDGQKLVVERLLPIRGSIAPLAPRRGRGAATCRRLHLRAAPGGNLLDAAAAATCRCSCTGRS
jgi:F-type H+-transporting ATPase subunit gamma